jgi:hypothetical protein
MTATIWRTCPSCYGSFEQPDDPGRKRVYCSRACQQAAYRARQRTSAGQHRSRQDQRQDWRSQRHEQRRQRPGSERSGAGQRQRQRQDWQDQQRRQRRPPPHSANGQRPGTTSGDDPSRHYLRVDPAGWRSHNDTAVGCIVWSTTASSSLVKASRSTSWRRRVLNRSIV